MAQNRCLVQIDSKFGGLEAIVHTDILLKNLYLVQGTLKRKFQRNR